MSILDTALRIAASGLPVFPCRRDKRPVFGHGFLDATTDAGALQKMFSRSNAELIGVPTGEASGFDVLDVDPRHGGDAWEAENMHRLPETRMHQSQSGGRHWLFAHNLRVRCSAGRIASGVDVRGEGGYIIMPGSPGYKIISDADPADWPEWLMQPGLVLPKPPPERPVSSTDHKPLNGARLDGYVKALLANVSRAPEGSKHVVLRNAGLTLGGIQVEAGFSDTEAIAWLMAALPSTVNDWKAAEKTAEWALAEGRNSPIDMEDRPRPNHAAANGGGPNKPAGTSQHMNFFDPWADPQPPDFPGGVLPSEIEDTVFATAFRDGLCPGTLAMAWLAAVSGAAHKGSRFQPYQNATWTVPPIVWVMAIARSGQRKTAVQENAFASLRELHGDEWRAHRNKILAWQGLPAKERRETPKPVEPHSFLVEDTTPEKLQQILAASDRGTVMLRDELAALFDFGRYSGGVGAAERAFYLQAYEGNQYTISRVSRDSLVIPVNGLAIFGGIQPERLADFPDLAKDGIIQRVNMVKSAESGVGRDTIVVKGTDKLNARIVTLARDRQRRYRTTPDGSEIIRGTERKGSDLATISEYGPGFQGTCSKLHGTHARYALILHLLDDPNAEIIPTETVERAGYLINDYLLIHARDFFASLTGSPMETVRNIAGWLLTRNPDRFLASDLMANVRQCRGMKTKELAELIDPLVSGGWLEPETPFPNNRAWMPNQALRDAFAERANIERERREQARRIILGIVNPRSVS